MLIPLEYKEMLVIFSFKIPRSLSTFQEVFYKSRDHGVPTPNNHAIISYQSLESFQIKQKAFTKTSILLHEINKQGEIMISVHTVLLNNTFILRKHNPL